MANSVHLHLEKSGKWYASFHHPIVRDGNVGKKINRSLNVSDAGEARRLGDRINDLLRIADQAPHLLPTRTDAELQYPSVVVGAFYDFLTQEPVDYLSLRNHASGCPESGSI